MMGGQYGFGSDQYSLDRDEVPIKLGTEDFDALVARLDDPVEPMPWLAGVVGKASIDL